MLLGLNHLTLAVRDLQRSVDFYATTLKFRCRAQWLDGAYLSLGDLWLCLSVDERMTDGPSAEYTHYAFTVSQDDFFSFVEQCQSDGVTEWKVNKSEGDSFYFLDPDGHRLEVHVGSLESRLRKCREQPYKGMKFFD